MHDFDLDPDANPDCVYVPAQGWWCRQCGVFRAVDDVDLCGDCRVAVRTKVTRLLPLRTRG